MIEFEAALLLLATCVGGHVMALHASPTLAYPLEQDVHLLELCIVQADPVAATPLEQEHTFCVHTRLAPEEQAVVCLFPVPQVRHALQLVPTKLLED